MLRNDTRSTSDIRDTVTIKISDWFADPLHHGKKINQRTFDCGLHADWHLCEPQRTRRMWISMPWPVWVCLWICVSVRERVWDTLLTQRGSLFRQRHNSGSFAEAEEESGLCALLCIVKTDTFICSTSDQETFLNSSSWYVLYVGHL